MKQRRIIFITVMAYLFGIGLDIGGFQLVLLKIAEEYHLSYSVMSMLVTIKCISNFICVLLIGPISDQIGKKRVLQAASVVYAAGCLLLLFSHVLELTIIGVVIAGMSFGLCEGMPSAMLADAFPEKADQYLSLSQAFCSAGAVLGPIAASRMIYVFHGEWRGIYLILCGWIILLAIALFFVKAEPAFQDEVGQQRKEKMSLDKEVKRMILLLVVIMFLYSGMENGMGYFIDTIFEKGYHISELATVALSGFWAAMLIMRLICVVMKKYHEVLTGFSFAGALICSIYLLFAQNGRAAVAGCILYGIACGPLWALILSFAVKQAREYSGTITGWISAASALGASVFPYVMGNIADLTGNVVFAVGVIVILAGAGTVLFAIYLKNFFKTIN